VGCLVRLGVPDSRLSALAGVHLQGLDDQLGADVVAELPDEVEDVDALLGDAPCWPAQDS
jgi:hypothetical protein